MRTLRRYADNNNNNNNCYCGPTIPGENKKNYNRFQNLSPFYVILINFE